MTEAGGFSSVPLRCDRFTMVRQLTARRMRVSFAWHVEALRLHKINWIILVLRGVYAVRGRTHIHESRVRALL